MAPRGKKGTSILKKLMIPMIVVTLVQAGVFYVTARYGGIVTQLSQNAFDILNERVSARTDFLQNEMVQRWSNVETTAHTLEQRYASFGFSAEQLAKQSDLASQYLLDVSRELVYLIKRNSVNGAFVVLGDTGGEADLHSALYIRDYDPVTGTADNSDLLVEVAPPSVTRKLGIPMDALWTSQLEFQPQGNVGDFFWKPWNAAFDYPEIESMDLGYWCPPYRLVESDIEVISYTVPLMGEDGKPFAVLGVELSMDYLHEVIPYEELESSKRGIYLLAIDDSSNPELDFLNVLANGPIYQQLFGEEPRTSFEPQPVFGCGYRAVPNRRQQEESFGCIQYLNLYNTNTPFEHERWALIGVMRRRDLLSVIEHVELLLAVSALVALLIGVVSVLMSSTFVTRPITYLVRRLRESDPNKPVHLEKIHIAEIDELATAIESMSTSVADSASKLTQLIELTDIALGAFEYDRRAKKVFFAGRLFHILGFDAGIDAPYLDVQSFRAGLSRLNLRQEESSDDGMERVYQADGPGGGTLWLRLKIVRSAERQLGVLVDITRDVEEKHKLEYERDFDLLTNLLNRRAFYTRAAKKFETPGELGTAAVMMLDLDNLKYVNDTYGHDYGDAYIRQAAGVLRRLTAYGAVVSRMSGDEFLTLICGYESKEQVRQLIEEVKEGMRRAMLPLPDGEEIRIRASAGVAWYPDDSDSLEQLVKYADFAMYKVKNTEKGEFSEFNIASYNREAYLLHAKEELNKLLDGELVQYAFQPIVRVCDGTVFAYEALMRSKLDTLKSPFEILSLARSQSQLYRVERMTMFRAVEDYLRYKGPQDDCRLFLNSIPNQILSEEDARLFEERYRPMLPKIVFELTEEEKMEDDILERKSEYIRSWGSVFAIDDYGTGYNGDAVLLRMTPQYLKVDITIVRGIDTDANRQRIMSSVAAYSHQLGIGVVAEGVETYGELETAIACGADYLQGYYLGLPKSVPQEIPPDIRDEVLAAHANLVK